MLERVTYKETLHDILERHGKYDVNIQKFEINGEEKSLLRHYIIRDGKVKILF